MGCKKATKGAFKWFWGWMKPAVVQAGVNMVKVLEEVTVPALTGEIKEKVAIQVVKDAAKTEGQELTTSAAKTLINGIHTMLINNQPIDELGQPDDNDEPDP